MISEAALNAKTNRQARTVLVTSRAAHSVIRGKLADAHAHATKALTETIRETPDGRPTTNKVRRSRSVEAAITRLQELLDGLAGPTIDSTEGLIRDARELMLDQAFIEWARLLDGSILRTNRSPTEAERWAIRRYEAHGNPLRTELQSIIDRKAIALRAAVAQASSRGIGSRAAGTILRTWEESSGSTILSVVKLVLSDSAVIADTAAQWLLIRPELRGDDDPPIEV